MPYPGGQGMSKMTDVCGEYPWVCKYIRDLPGPYIFGTKLPVANLPGN